MTEFVAGGRRRIDRVLAPEFLDDLGGLTLDEIRGRRTEADQEEVDLSFARRLIQGRLDLLRAERAVADVGNSNYAAMTDVQVAEAISNLEDIETRVSRSRRRVQLVVDTLTGEVARRYQLGEVEALDDDPERTAQLGIVEPQVAAEPH